MLDLSTGVLVAAFANNALLAHAFGIEHLGRELEARRSLLLTAVLASIALPAVMLAWLLARPSFALDPSLALYGLVLACAALGVIVRRVLHSVFPRGAALLATSGPLLLLDSLVLAVAVASSRKDAGLTSSLLGTLASVAGFGLILLLLAAMRERLRGADIPKTLRGLPIELVNLALISLAAIGLAGIGQHA